MEQPEPFDPRVTREELDDLRARIRATRWPDSPYDAGWSLGVDVDYLRELAEYWGRGVRLAGAGAGARPVAAVPAYPR